LFLAACRLVAQDIPVRSWDVPPLPGELGKRGAAYTIPSVFSAISPPCRLYDSRISSGGPGPIPASGTRTFDFTPAGSPACGPIPNVLAMSLYITVVGPLGPGFIYGYPTDNPPATPTSIINYNGTPGELRNNATILMVDTGGRFTIGTGGAGTDIIIDINGFFDAFLEDNPLTLTSNTIGATIHGQNSASGVTGIGVEGSIFVGASAGSAGVWGAASASSNPNTVYGGMFTNNSTAAESAAVLANSDGSSGMVYGVFADNDSSTSLSAGVFGRSGNNVFPAATATYGVAGASYNSGNTRNVGVGGFAQGGTQAFGVYGVRDGAILIGGVLGYTGSSGVHSFNDITAGGTKSFIQPHPTDPGLEIAYVSLEGPEAGTYFRGKGRFENGLARIPVPESFRLVSEEDGLSVQVTPIGEMAAVAVLRIGLEEIVVKGSRNVEFFYTVNGVRKGHGGFEAIRKNEHFRPASAEDEMREWPPEVRARLIANGTLTPEGMPNPDTAKRLGWKAEWEAEAANAKAQREDEISRGGFR
jgi:hypothetical protein